MTSKTILLKMIQIGGRVIDVIYWMNLDQLDKPEQCTCECPDGEGQHLDGCHSYDTLATVVWRNSARKSVVRIQRQLSDLLAKKHVHRILEDVRQLIIEAFELRESELQDQNRLNN